MPSPSDPLEATSNASGLPPPEQPGASQAVFHAADTGPLPAPHLRGQHAGSMPGDNTYVWRGRDQYGKPATGKLRAASAAQVRASLAESGMLVASVRAERQSGRVRARDIAMLTRQLATLLKAGAPLLQSFTVIAQSHANPALSRLIMQLGAAVENGSSLRDAFARHPRHFDPLFCSLIAAGEQAGILDELLLRLALYQERTLALKAQIRSALIYPAAIMTVALLVTAIVMAWVVPAFAAIFAGFGAELPLMTRAVMALSDWFVACWHVLAALLGVAVAGAVRAWRKSLAFRARCDRWLLGLPVLGAIVRQACAARWAATLATTFAAGVPLVEGLDAVGGASGNSVFEQATRGIQRDVSAGTTLARALQDAGVFPPLLPQMAAIGEESGALDQMLGNAAQVFQEEVDRAVAAASTLMEPIIMVVLGLVIGMLLIAMYLPVLTLGSVI